MATMPGKNLKLHLQVKKNVTVSFCGLIDEYSQAVNTGLLG
jgi:hypothetical protein